MRLVGLDPTRHAWALVRHERSHAHLVIARVRDDGATWSCEAASVLASLERARWDEAAGFGWDRLEALDSKHPAIRRAWAEVRDGKAAATIKTPDGKQEQVELLSDEHLRQIDAEGTPMADSCSAGTLTPKPSYESTALRALWRHLWGK
jgi:hypothetical protein